MYSKTNTLEEEKSNIHKKSINNAISAYFMVLISVTFLFNKKNQFLNNDFVKSHTKVAFLIHLSFLLTYIIFISFSFLQNISILEYNLNYILASSIFTFLFIGLLYWVHKANSSKKFKIWELINIWSTHKIIDINWDWKLDEKDKLTLILSYVPFLWYFIQWKYYKNKSVNNIIKLNLIISIIITLIYISWNKNITLLFLLFYIIFAVFSSINIVVREVVIWVNLSFIPNIWEIISSLKSFIKYLKNYLWNKEFIWISEIKKIYKENKINTEIKDNSNLKKLKITKFPNFLIYFPFINIISLLAINSNKKIHIINWVMITIFFIIFSILNFYWYIPNNSYIILLFPICFWLWYINSRIAYKIPIIYDLFELLVYIKNIFIRTKKVIKEKKAEVHSETIKVWEINIENKEKISEIKK